MSLLGASLQRAPSLEIAEILGVTRAVARAALNFANGDPNEAIANLLTSVATPNSPPLTALSRSSSEELRETENELIEFSGITREMARMWLAEAGNDLTRAKENFIREVLGEDQDAPEQRTALQTIENPQGVCPICMDNWEETEVEVKAAGGGGDASAPSLSASALHTSHPNPNPSSKLGGGAEMGLGSIPATTAPAPPLDWLAEAQLEWRQKQQNSVRSSSSHHHPMSTTAPAQVLSVFTMDATVAQQEQRMQSSLERAEAAVTTVGSETEVAVAVAVAVVVAEAEAGAEAVQGAASVVRLRACRHQLCRSCLDQYIRVEVAQGKVEILCPVPDCRLPLQQREVRAIIGTEAFMKLDRQAVEIAVMADPTLHLCPSPDCTYVCSWAGPEDGPPRLNCPICKGVRCLMCAQPWHPGFASCEEAKRFAAASGGGGGASAAEEEMTLAYLASSNVRRCKRCGNGVVKSAGCNKMKCRCGYRFCYECGAENCIKNGENCGCTPASHGFIDNLTGYGDFTNLRDVQSPN